EVTDVHVDRAIERRGLAPVQLFHQLVAGDHAASGAHESFEDVELERSYFHRRAFAKDIARAGVDHDTVDLEFAAGLALLETPHYGADSGYQLAGVDRLGQIVVRAKLDADDPVLIFA